MILWAIVSLGLFILAFISAEENETFGFKMFNVIVYTSLGILSAAMAAGNQATEAFVRGLFS